MIPDVARLLQIDGVRLELGGRAIVDEVSLAVSTGQMVGLIGRNGSGKSTLLKAVYRSLRPAAGTVWIDGADLWSMPIKSVATLRAVVTQVQEGAADLTVAETVLTGRTAHQPLLARTSPADHDAVTDALQRVSMDWAARRPLSTLSGGERQRVLIARALAQQTPFIVLDEPTNHLDICSALGILELVRNLRLGVLAALHDLDHAAAYCDQLVVLQDGRVLAAGAPEQVLTADLIAEVFGVQAVIGTNALTGRISVTVGPLPDHHRQERSA